MAPSSPSGAPLAPVTVSLAIRIRIAIDNVGNVYVSDQDNNRIQKFGPNGTFITKWGTSGSGNGQFDQPGGIAVNSSRDVYVADSGNNNESRSSLPTALPIRRWTIGQPPILR